MPASEGIPDFHAIVRMERTMNRFTGLLAGGVAVLALLGATSANAGEVVTQAQIEAAQTAEQHEAIAKSYDDEAVAAERSADSHAKLVQTYRLGFNKTSGASMANHCLRLEESFRSAAVEYRMLAKEHREMAAKAN
jgi:hypothetical protein